MQIEVLPFASAIGAEIKCDDVKRLDHEAFTKIQRAFLDLETLPASLRSAIADKSIKHNKRYTSGGQLRPGYLAEQDLRTSPGPTHPIIRRHPETGRSALYLGRRPHAYINGLPLAESE